MKCSGEITQQEVVEARGLKGRSSSPKDREQRWGSPTVDQGFSSIHGTLFGFCGIYILFDAWILPSGMVDPSEKVPDLNCEVQHLLLDVVDLE